MKTFAHHTTARVGGSAGEWVTAYSDQLALAVLREHHLPSDADRAAGRDTLLVLGGGSNLLVSDEGFGGTVLQLAFSGISAVPDRSAEDDAVIVTVAAGHSWEALVAWTVDRGLYGLEALSGIPGTVGASPVQNVGAYGTDVSQTILDVTVWDRVEDERIILTNEDLQFGYRDSLLKRETIFESPRYVVVEVRFRLHHAPGRALSAPVRYAELARQLGMDPNLPPEERRTGLREVREKVLELRSSKGMVLDPQDHDTWSTGSFFTNPILRASDAVGVPEEAPRFPAGHDEADEPMVKLSAAWLIEHAGAGRGFGAELTDGRASLSTKHTLAVTNRGSATAADMLTVARAARDRVLDAFGIDLHPEPVLVGCAL
ncbi:UDP-N-acetylmuramate dehydrogenase [Nesterenkonia sp. NBAIMH1]|uniref:UDP-N-acetylmuramate dehydrogenase n=1 Tax=Nesterenkonia sp. NBAIMH1 TaxID=2600320 RepID=UPI0011B77CF5|nr:UDP-N-acetylmuramate dehydrogenase [Nesterenkonia sp. NBAIMH1]